MADWSDWEPWGDMWDQWVRTVREDHINLKHLNLVNLYRFFVRQVELLKIDPATVDVKAFVDPRLSYDENKRILASIIGTPPTTEEYEAMYEHYKAELESQVKEKYPEVWETWEKRIEELERETEKLPRVEREKEKYKLLAEELAYKLEETERRVEQEREALERKLAPVKLRILKDWEEGIMKYRSGAVIETRDLDWALGKIEEGYAERVPVEVPVAPPPVEKPPTVRWTKELERRLTDLFRVVLTRSPGYPYKTVQPRHLAELRTEFETIKTQPTVEQMERMVEELAKEIIRREGRPPTPPTAPPRIEIPPFWRKFIERVELYAPPRLVIYTYFCPKCRYTFQTNLRLTRCPKCGGSISVTREEFL